MHITMLTKTGEFLGIFCRILPRPLQKRVVVVFGYLVRKTQGKMSSALFLLCFPLVKQMYFNAKKAVVLRRRMPDGFLMRLDVTKKTQRILYLQKQYEPYVYNYIRKRLTEGNVFVDIGANVGFYSLLSARLVGPSGHVFSFEPERENYASLVKNIRLNGFQNVSAIQKAVGAKNGTMTLNLNPLNEGGHSLRDLREYGDDKEIWSKEQIKERFPNALLEQRVDVISFDVFLARAHIKKIPRIIKIDIEGAEFPALCGMRKLLNAANAPDIIGEISRDGKQILSLMNDFGYRAYTLDHTGTPSAFAGRQSVKAKALLFSKNKAAAMLQ